MGFELVVADLEIIERREPDHQRGPSQRIVRRNDHTERFRGVPRQNTAGEHQLGAGHRSLLGKLYHPRGLKVTETSLPGVLLIEPAVFGDTRGFFMETWQALKFRAFGIDAKFVQDNHSRSTQWTLRGMHVQVAHKKGRTE